VKAVTVSVHYSSSVLCQSRHSLRELYSTNYVNRIFIRRHGAHSTAEQSRAAELSARDKTSESAPAAAAESSRGAVTSNYSLITNQYRASYIIGVCVPALFSH